MAFIACVLWENPIPTPLCMHYLVLLCTTSSGRIIRVLSEQKMFLDRKKSKIIALCFKIIQRSPPQSPSQREITCQNICLCGWNWHASELSIGRQDEPEPSCFTRCWRGQVCLFVGSCQGREDSWRTGFGTWQPTGGSFPSERRTLPRVRAAAGRRVLCCVQLMPHSRY